MQSPNRRWAYYYDLNLTSIPKDAPRFELKEVFEKLKHFQSQGNAVKKYRNEEITFRLKHIKETKQCYLMLIHVSDVKATDPAFSNIESGNVRVEEKKENEGIGAACHVLIKKQPLDGKSRHLAILEEVVGLPKSQIEKFFTYLLKECCASTYISSPAEPKPKRCRPGIKLEGHASESLKKSLKTGQLQGVTLLSKNEGHFIDDDSELRLTEKVMKLKVSGTPTGSKALDLLNKAKDFAASHNYDEVRVQYSEIVAEELKRDKKGKVEKKAIKKQRTVPFNTKQVDLANAIFTKSELIELNNNIGQCESEVHVELANKMQRLVIKAVER